MKPLSRLSIDHRNYQGPQLHNDLNKTVEQTNLNFTEHQTLLEAQQKTLASQASTISSLLARIAALENASD